MLDHIYDMPTFTEEEYRVIAGALGNDTVQRYIFSCVQRSLMTHLSAPVLGMDNSSAAVDRAFVQGAHALALDLTTASNRLLQQQIPQERKG